MNYYLRQLAIANLTDIANYTLKRGTAKFNEINIYVVWKNVFTL